MKHVRGITQPHPQEALIFDDLLGFLVSILLSPVVFLLNLFGKNLAF